MDSGNSGATRQGTREPHFCARATLRNPPNARAMVAHDAWGCQASCGLDELVAAAGRGRLADLQVSELQGRGRGPAGRRVVRAHDRVDIDLPGERQRGRLEI